VLRATRVRRLRIRRAIRATTAVVGAMLLVSTLAFARAASSRNATDVGVWVMERPDAMLLGKAASAAGEATVSAVAVGPSLTVSVRAVVSGKVHDVTSNAETVGALLSAMGIQPDADDRVVPSPSTPLLHGSTVRFDEVAMAVRRFERRVDFGVHTVYTSRLAPGQVRVLTPGSPGLVRTIRLVRTVNGRVAERTTIARTVIRRPVTEQRLSGPMAAGAGTLSEPGTGARGQTGIATWYDPPWSGASAAHPWLPFGTMVLVTDIGSGRSVTVVIDDRGPFAPGRIIDLSPEAFAQLAPLGRGVLRVSISW